jgi:hypothetical protein
MFSVINLCRYQSLAFLTLRPLPGLVLLIMATQPKALSDVFLAL